MEDVHTNGTSSPIKTHVHEIGNSAQRLVLESRGLVTDVAATLDLKGRLERHPYQTLLIAAGVGYILGGGLFTSLTAGLLRTGLRVVALPVVKNQLTALAEAALAGTNAPIQR